MLLNFIGSDIQKIYDDHHMMSIAVAGSERKKESFKKKIRRSRKQEVYCLNF